MLTEANERNTCAAAVRTSRVTPVVLVVVVD